MYFDRNQEVPTLEEFENQMYNSDFVLPDYLLGAEEELMFEVPDVKKEEDEYIDYSFAAEGYEIRPSTPIGGQPLTQQQTQQQLINNMPVLCEQQSYVNPYSSVIVSSLASPSSPYPHSPASTTYSSSPVQSPQQPQQPEDFLRYGLRQALHARHVAQAQSSGYPYYMPEYTAGGRRKRRDFELSPEDYEKRRLRRERNKLAALRCRTRRRERIDNLEQETAEIEQQNASVENEISDLQKQVDDLQSLLKQHKCTKKINLNDSTQSKVDEVRIKKEFMIESSPPKTTQS